MKLSRAILWFLFAFFAMGVGVYPFFYFLADMSNGLLSLKPANLLKDAIWSTAFYLHISFGGIALLIGWTQFSHRLRTKRLKIHRWLGKLYVIAVLISGVSGCYIAIYATGGISAITGFAALAISWLFTTGKAYASIRNADILMHRQWMLRSYALTFAAVTLRIWMPFLSIAFQMDFIDAYVIVAWLCWIPNLLIAEILLRKANAQHAIS